MKQYISETTQYAERNKVAYAFNLLTRVVMEIEPFL